MSVLKGDEKEKVKSFWVPANSLLFLYIHFLKEAELDQSQRISTNQESALLFIIQSIIKKKLQQINWPWKPNQVQ